MSKYLFQSSNHCVLLGRSRHEEIANLSEDEDGKEDVAKATEDGMVLPIILKAENSNVCLYKVWERDFCTTCMSFA